MTATAAIAICRREALPFAGPTSARFAAIVWGMGRRFARIRAAGRDGRSILRRSPVIAAAWIAALAAERLTTPCP